VWGGSKAELDALFALPLAEFTGARNALAARLKKEGKTGEAEQVKAMPKPSISAWTVNQLYWNHRGEFEHLVATGSQVRKAQESQLAGKSSDFRGANDARRAALTNLSRLAASLLNAAGHNPTPDVLRRIATTLEAVSAVTAFPEGQSPGRLTEDLDPPGFETLGSFVPATKSVAPQPEKIAAAKVALKNAESALKEARSAAQAAETALKAAEDRFREAGVAAEEAKQDVFNAERSVQQASERLRFLA